ncbi:MAG: amino acid adenylation domain-containing protein, partial [Acidobacteriota bacterium]
MSNQESSAAKRRRMLEKLRAKKKAQGASPAPDGAQPKGREAIPKLDRGGLLPLSFGQERLWLLDQLSPGGNAFNMSFPLRLAGELDPEVVLRALRELVARHEALRTTLVTEDGVTRQRIHPPEFVEPRFVDLSTLGDAERDDRLEELRREVLAEGFDLAVGPLYRAVLVRLAPAEHMLLQSVHHIVNDGWSIGILFRELRTLLEAFGKGEPSPLPELPLQYADFAAWQRGRLRGAHLEDGLAYWRDRLAGAAGTLDLPKDRPRPPRSSERGVQIQATVDADLAARLRALAADRRATLFVAMLAAFDVLMHRLSGQDDVLVGSPVAGRHRREVEGIVGFFLDTLILRTRVEGTDTFEEVFAKTRETVLGATAHQDVPFEKLLEELRPERHLSQTPFFQVLFNMANIPDMRFELPGLEATLDEISDQGAKFDFTLYVLEEGDGLAVDLHYDADLFDRARMVHLLEQYVGLLEQVAADPTRRVADYDLAVGVAKGRLPDPTAPLADDWRGTVGQALRARAAEHPERIAVSDTESEIPYADLDRRVDLLARRLRSAGLRRGDVVAIWAHRAAELVEAMVGVLRAGCAFTVLDPTYPTSRLVSYVDKAQARGLVKVPGADDPPPEVLGALTPPASAAGNAPVLDIGADPEPSVDWDADDGDAQIGPADLAYVAFTSGSTGEPKAIHGGQGSLTHFIKAFREIFGLGSDGDRYSMLSALSHDPLHRDVFLPLCLGATIVVPEQERIGQPGYLADWIRDRGVTVANLVPSMLQLLVQSTEDRGPNENRAPIDSLRRVFTVGEVLTRRDVDSLYRLAPRVRCFNLYGATETQRAVSYVAVPLDADPDPESDLGTGGLDHAALPLGRGLDGVQLLVRNGAGHLAGIGELGEIYVRSHHLALGYADEDATRDRFLPNPFVDGPQAGDRLYRTGDLGRYLPNGDVEFAGRVDAQVKIRGFRIELQEIEAALEGHPGIAGTAVAVRGEGGDPFLAAYLVPADGAPAPEPGELRSALSQRLPEYMVPSAFVVLDRLPRTRTGKLDRRALPEPELGEGVEFRAPESVEEKVLAAIWGEVLGRDGVGLDDHFFGLGGHSLLAAQVLARLRRELGVEVPLRLLFERPVLVDLAAAVSTARASARLDDESAAPDPSPIETLPRDLDGGLASGAPLSFAQQRLWFLDQLEPGSAAYVLSWALRLRGPLDAQALGRAFDDLVSRHEVLRTRFVAAEAGEPVQIVDPPRPRALPVVDLTALGDAALGEARHRASAAATRPFELHRGPLLRTELLRLGHDDHGHMLSLHPIVGD